MRTAFDQIALFPGLPTAVTPDMKRDLAKLEASRTIGMTRTGRTWSGTGGRIAVLDAASLISAQLARVDYTGRHPRLKITAKGRRAIGAYEEEARP